MPDSLTATLTSAQATLVDRTKEATVIPFPVGIRECQTRMDRLLSSLSRHVHALEAVFVVEVRRHLGAAPARELARLCHELQLDTLTLKGRLYGSAQTMHLTWRAVWNDLQHHLAALLELEGRLATELADLLADAELDDITGRLCEAEDRAPTRPHPHIPQRGVPGRLARRLVRNADALWDGLEGRDAPIATLVRPDLETDLETGTAS